MSATNPPSLQNLMIAHSANGIALMRGPNFVFETANQKFAELVGPREYLGKAWREVYPELPNSPLPRIMKLVFETGDPFSARDMKMKVEVAKGIFEDRYYDIDYTRVMDADNKPYGIFCQTSNVTERVEVQHLLRENSAELATAVKLLNQEKEARERFISALTHDLRTPLTAIKMSAQLLTRKPDNAELVTSITRRVVASVDRADKMIRDLLDANRIKAGQSISITPEHANLNRLIEESIADLRAIFGDRFETNLGTTSVEGYWDGETIRRAIENLAANAIKYGDKSSPVKISLKDLGKHVEISVHNSGDPIPEANRQTIFSQYNRTHTAVNSGQIGWGVGLALVKGITEVHGGSVRVESSEEAGTTFTIDLPMDARSRANS